MLKEKFKEKLIILSIVVDKAIRYERISKREVRSLTKEEAIERDISEIETIAKAGPIAYADYYILNNGSIDEYINNLKNISKL